MIYCAVCGVSDAEQSVLAIRYRKGQLVINQEDVSKPVYYICTGNDCLVKAKAGDFIGKAFGKTLDASNYLRIAKYAKSSPKQTLESLIGLARKSGAVIVGTESVVQNVKRRAVHLMLVDPDTSMHTLDKLERLTNRFNCPLQKWPGSKSIEQVLNKDNCKVIGISDLDMAKIIQGMM